MSFFRRAKEVSGDLASAGKRQAQRAKLKREVGRLKSRMASEHAAIGQAVYPLLEAGTLVVDLPEVAAHTNTVSGLLAEMAGKQAQIDSLRSKAAAERAERHVKSMHHIDTNASPQAAAEQSAKDVASEERQDPAEQGGEG